MTIQTNMRLINLIDNCGQLLNIILKSPNSADRTAESFFRDKRKIIGSKERKFISQIVFASIRNLILIKNISSSLELEKHLDNSNVFIKGKKHSIMVLIQILLAENFHSDFNYILLDDIKYTENKKTLSIIESICADLSAIQNTNNILNYVGNELSKNIVSYFQSFKNCAKTNHFNFNDIDTILSTLENLYSFPKEFVNNLLISQQVINKNNIFDFVNAMNRPANTCIRVNNSITDVNNVINILKEQGIESHRGNIAPHCIIIPERRQLTTLDIYKKGYFTIQDEASQLVGYSINPNLNDTILDACAGAGGKTLHLADLQNDKGNITATDIDFIKLKEIIKRAKLTNYKSIKIALNNNLQKNKKFDIVLVDAPCSGSGTIRRDPMKKYTILTKTINKIAQKQLELLTNYSKYVKAGGTLLYSTCSIFPQENENIVNQFLDANSDFVPEPLYPHLAKHKINLTNLTETDSYITLYPSTNNTDGFFISRLKKKSF